MPTNYLGIMKKIVNPTAGNGLFELVVSLLQDMREDVREIRQAVTSSKGIKETRMTNKRKMQVKTKTTASGLIKTREAMKILGVSRTGFQSLVRTGKLSSVSGGGPGNPLCFSREAVLTHKKNNDDIVSNPAWLDSTALRAVLGLGQKTQLSKYLRDKTVRTRKIGTNLYYFAEDAEQYRNQHGKARRLLRKAEVAEDRNKLASLISGARKALGLTQRELVDKFPTVSETYIGYDGLAHNTEIGNSQVGKVSVLGQIERGIQRPSSVTFYQLMEALELPKSLVEEAMCLLPLDTLLEMEEMGLNPLKRFEEAPKAEPVAEVSPEEIVEAEKALEDSENTMFPESVKPQTRHTTVPLKIAVLGSHGKNWARHAEEGWGRHQVMFLDTDKLKEIHGQYDLIVEAGASHKATWKLEAENGGHIPIAAFESGVRVKTPRSLRNWLALYDHGLVKI